jgi:hypothetical protein
MPGTQRGSRQVSQPLNIDGLTSVAFTGHPHNDATVAPDQEPVGSRFALTESTFLLLEGAFFFPAMP